MNRSSTQKFPNQFYLQLILWIYQLVWIMGLPFVLLFFIKKSLKEPSYRRAFLERFGFGKSNLFGAIWVHAVSLGEFRAAVPLVRNLLKMSEKVLITTITPAGREEAKKTLKKEIDEDLVQVLYLPFEFGFCFRLFFKRHRPKFGIILEYELWPILIVSSSKAKVPLVLAQAKYNERSFFRDKNSFPIRGRLLDGFKLILAKSELHASRFRYFTDTNVEVMGELRFEQPIPSEQLHKANHFLNVADFKNTGRTCLCMGSTGQGEDEKLFYVMEQINKRVCELGIPKPFYIYVPRHKRYYDKIKKLSIEKKLVLSKRSEILDENLKKGVEFENFLKQIHLFDGMVGDSFGEINFYFQMADCIFIGDSFNDLGCHNIIEPLALKKPVVVGPSTRNIEYPLIEALRVDIVKKVNNPDELIEYWLRFIMGDESSRKSITKVDSFYSEHSGATDKCIKHLKKGGLL